MSTTYTVCTRVWLFACYTHTHTHLTALSGTTRVSRYQKGKTNLDFTEARDSGWQWHQLGYMQVCAPLQTDNRTSTPTLFMFFLQVGCPSCRPTNSVKALKLQVGCPSCRPTNSVKALKHCLHVIMEEYFTAVWELAVRWCITTGHCIPGILVTFSVGIERPSVTWCRIENRHVYDYLIVFKKS